LANCAPTGAESFVATVKRLSATVTGTLTRLLGGLLPDLVAKLVAANAMIQGVADGDVGGILRVAVPAFIAAVQAILAVLPVPIPPLALAAINTILSFLAGLFPEGVTASAVGQTHVTKAQVESAVATLMAIR
jgi:hypothetical protein